MSSNSFETTWAAGRAKKALAFGVVVMFVLLFSLLVASPAHAKTITVETISNDPLSTDKCTLEGAITAANTNTAYATHEKTLCPAGDPSSTARDTIAFNIPDDPNVAGNEVKKISLTRQLPEITETVTIDGYTQPGAKANTRTVGNDAVLLIELDGAGLGSGNTGLRLTGRAPNSEVRGLVINGFNPAGISITGTYNKIEGNFIGTDASGTLDRGNFPSGVDIGRGSEIPGVDNSGSNNTVGGALPAARNVISGNDIWGVSVFGTTGTKIEGNYVGTTKNGTTALGNSNAGVYFAGGSDNTVGSADPAAANTIAFNGAHGVSLGMLDNSYGIGSRILSNSIFSNAGLGIDLNDNGPSSNDGDDPATPRADPDNDTGANNLQNYPVITSAKTKGSRTTIRGTLNSTPNTTFTIQLFSSPKSTKEEGKKFIGQLTGEQSVITDDQGNASFSIRLPKTGGFVTATATNDATGDTSEFSRARKVIRL